jgi:hypothetical protein
MMDKKTKAIPLASKVSNELVKIVTQYGSRPNRFAGMDNAFSVRHLVFDNVINPTGPSPHTAILNVVRSWKFSSDDIVAEYTAGIWKVEPCPVP